MLPEYDDIKRRLGQPKWYTDQGVPRYDDFKPGMLGVYGQAAALFLCQCQACDLEIPVGIGWDRYDLVLLPPTDYGPSWCCIGDPPRHDCEGAGETMTSSTTQILQYWTKDEGRWKRQPQYELTMRMDRL